MASHSAMTGSALTAQVVLALLLLVVQLPSCSSVVRTRSSKELEGVSHASRPPRLYFLFMAEGEVPNVAIWKRFFSDAMKGVDYEAYLHCSEPLLCKKANLHREPILNMIDTVPSEWCRDLVTPMNALLSAALGNHTDTTRVTESANENDKFIFLSASTVPLKPFSFVQHKLTVADGHKSNFCVQEWPKWAFYSADRVVPKSSQWMVLSRTHALNAMTIAKVFTPQQMMRQMVPLRWLGTERVAPTLWKVRKHVTGVMHSPILDRLLTFIVPAVRGCADEFWHLAATVGSFDPAGLKKGVVFEDLAGGVLSMKDEDQQRLQGHCDTFALVDADDTKNNPLIQGNGTAFGGQSGFLRPHIHAGKFLKLSEPTLESLRSSEYLFARKMDGDTKFISDGDSMTLLQAFDKIVFPQH